MSSIGITMFVFVMVLVGNALCIAVCDDLKLDTTQRIRAHVFVSGAMLVLPFVFMALTWVYSLAAWGIAL